MQKKREKPAAPSRASPKRPESGPSKGRRVVRKLAHATLLAAGIAVVRFTTPEMDPRFEMFDRTLLDRLEAPITRYHE
jgi:hypothetical protein